MAWPAVRCVMSGKRGENNFSIRHYWRYGLGKTLPLPRSGFSVCRMGMGNQT